MASHGFGSISLEGFVYFQGELSRGEWGADDISPYLPEGRLPEDLSGINPFLFHKLDLHLTLAAVSQAVGADPSARRYRIDKELDALENSLILRLQLARVEASSDELRAAVAHCEAKLLIPNMVGLSYEREVAHARLQLRLSTQDPEPGERSLREDVASLGLGALLQKIGAKAEELDQELKKDDNTTARRLLAARRECGRALNHAYEALLRLEKRAAPGGVLARMIARRKEPFEILLARYIEADTPAAESGS